MESTASHPRLSRPRLASPPRCKSARSRCRPIQNHKRSLHRNQQYSITAITDASGAIIERYAYTAYGTPTITDASGTTRTTSGVGNRYTYTGREWDETLALYHYRARMYDSVGGRFVSRDPIGFMGSDYGLYEYCSSKPLISLDPSGEIDWSKWPSEYSRDLTVEQIKELIKNTKDPKELAKLKRMKKIKEQFLKRLAEKIKVKFKCFLIIIVPIYEQEYDIFGNPIDRT